MTKLLAWSAAMLLVGGAHPAIASGNAAPGRPASIDAVDYEDDRRRVLWFDPELKKLQAQLYRALPGTVNFTTGWSQDDKRALVWWCSGADPGGYYLLDRATARMHPVINPYPEINPDSLAPVKYVRYQAATGSSSLPIFGFLEAGSPKACP